MIRRVKSKSDHTCREDDDRSTTRLSARLCNIVFVSTMTTVEYKAQQYKCVANRGMCR